MVCDADVDDANIPADGNIPADVDNTQQGNEDDDNLQ